MLNTLLQWFTRRKKPAAGSVAPTQHAAAAGAQLQQAADLWVAQITAGRQQARAAVADLIAGFGDILVAVDDILGADPASAAGADCTVQTKLAHCEARLDKLLARLHDMAASRRAAAATFDGLVAASSGLGGMAEDVSRLARQTGLLSINAAIEAARAGSSGRGFAVVATEVRRLSRESGDTGLRISSQVGGFMSGLAQARSEVTAQAANDESAIGSSSQDISGVMADLATVVADAGQQAAAMQARSRQVKTAVETMLAALQFHDRVDQILTQVCDSITRSAAQLKQSLADGLVTDPQLWSEVLHQGYTTAEQADIAQDRTQSATAKVSAAPIFF